MTVGNQSKGHYRIEEGRIAEIPPEEGPARPLSAEEIEAALDALFVVSDEKGGAGSGHHGHAGIIGHHGGSLPGPGTSWAHHGGQRDPVEFVGSGEFARRMLTRRNQGYLRKDREYEQEIERRQAEVKAIVKERGEWIPKWSEAFKAGKHEEEAQLLEKLDALGDQIYDKSPPIESGRGEKLLCIVLRDSTSGRLSADTRGQI